MQKDRSYFFLLGLLFISINCMSQVTTWNGTSWDNGIPTISMDAVFTGNYANLNDISCQSLSIDNNAQVTVSSGNTLTVQNNLTVNSGASLLFENNASLIQINPVAINTGNIIYRRNSTPIRQFEYTYWASPVSGQNLIGFSPLTAPDRYYSFDNTANDWVLENSSNTMQAGKGYAIRVPNNFTSTPQVFNGEFTGIPNNGNVSATVVAYNPLLLNYSLLGNPYPSAISVASLIDNSTLGTLYFWTHNSAISNNIFTTADYAIRTRNSGIAAISGGIAPGAFIAAGEGFFAPSSVTGTVIFTNTMRVSANNSQFYKTNQKAFDPSFYYYWLNMTNAGGAFKQISIGYEQGATNGYDFGVDAAPAPGTYITFYSMIGTGTYAIQGRAYPWNATDIIPLGYNSTIADTFQIAIDHNDTFFNSQDIFLEDVDLGIVHNLKTSPYSFTSAIGTFNNRFKIRYVDPTLSTATTETNPSTLYLFTNENGVNINSTFKKIKSVEVADILGRIVYKRSNTNQNKIEITTIKAQNQTLIIKVRLENDQEIARKITY